MAETKQFDLEIERSVGGILAWPNDEEATEFDFEGNELYVDLRHVGWGHVEYAIARDRRFIEEYALAGAIPPSARGTTPSEDEIDDDGLGYDWELELQNALDALDPGVAGAVACLAACGCVPFTSCNGGAFGDRHNGAYPLVRFFVIPEALGGLLECAAIADIGLKTESDGRVEIFARKVEDMVGFAVAVLDRCGRSS